MKILVLTTEPENFVPVELKKQATAEGHECEIVNLSKLFMYETTGDAKVMVVSSGNDEEPEPKPIELVGDICIPRLSEHNLEFKLGLLKRLSTKGVTMLNSPESMELCNDKLQTQILLNNAGILTPASTLIGSTATLNATLAYLEDEGKLKFPIIIKTLRGTHGVGVMKVDSKSSLVSVAQTLLKQGMHFMLQEFIEHDESKRMIMLGTEVLCANTRSQPKDKDEFRTNSHLGSTTKKYVVNEEEIALGAQIVRLFGCEFCAIDYIILDGKLMVLEVNGSPGLEAIQKDWEGEKNLALEVIKHCALKGAAQPESPPEAAPESDMPEEPTAGLDTPPAEEPVGPFISEIEKVIIKRIVDDGVVARVDTGAKYCSLHVSNINVLENYVSFTRGDAEFKVPIVKTIGIRNSHGSSKRPLVALDLVVKGISVSGVLFTLNDRGNLTYEALLGRELLSKLGLPVKITNPEDDVRSDLAADEIEEE